MRLEDKEYGKYNQIHRQYRGSSPEAISPITDIALTQFWFSSYRVSTNNFMSWHSIATQFSQNNVISINMIVFVSLLEHHKQAKSLCIAILQILLGNTQWCDLIQICYNIFWIRNSEYYNLDYYFIKSQKIFLWPKSDALL